jgi:NADH dehydrogenase
MTKKSPGAPKNTAAKPLDAAIMVTGGSGFVGQHLVKALAEQGRTVVSVYHHRLPESLESVYPVCSDMSSVELMLAPLRGVETVVHLAWDGGLAGPDHLPWPPQAGSPPTRNTQMLANLIGAMERAGTKRLVLLSAIGASYQSEAAYLREKYWAELLTLNSRIPEKVVVRASVVWGGHGSDDRFLRSILRVMKFPLYPVPSKKEQMAPVHVKDLAETLARACKLPLPEAAAVVDVDGGEPLKVNELFRIVSDQVVKKTRFPIGGFLGDSLLPLLERDSKVGPKTPKLSHFLALGGRRAAQPIVETEKPLEALLPERPASFKDQALRN